MNALRMRGKTDDDQDQEERLSGEAGHIECFVLREVNEMKKKIVRGPAGLLRSIIILICYFFTKN